jgi:hypothetical protein
MGLAVCITEQLLAEIESAHGSRYSLWLAREAHRVLASAVAGS